MTQLEKAYTYLDKYHNEMISLWEEFVRLESPSAVPEKILAPTGIYHFTFLVTAKRTFHRKALL